MPHREVLATAKIALGTDEAFRAFTQEIDRWWQRDPARPDAIVQFHGNALVSVHPEGTQLLAEVTQWSPPSLLQLRWHGPHAQAGDVVTVGLAPEGTSTRVTIRHRRDGLEPGDAVGAVLGLWWGSVLSRFTAGHAGAVDDGW